MPTAVEHVIIIVKENHCFDNYFGTFHGALGMTMPRSPNPPPQDPDHRHKAWLTRETTAVRQQFVEADIPAYFSYARQFTLCDHVSKVTHSHVSLLKFCTVNFGLQPFNQRVAAAGDMSDCFNFAQAPGPPPH